MQGELVAAERLLVRALANAGVTSVRFITPRPTSVWLITQGDAEADPLGKRTDLRGIVFEALQSACLGSEAIEEFGIVVQSEQTVARDYEGSWFYAMR